MTDDTAVQSRRSTPDDFDGFYDCFAAICRERRYLALVDAPPKDASRAFVADAHQRGAVQYVAVANGRIVAWCDIIPHAWEGFRHSGRLGMGLAPEYRGKGIGRHLVEATVRDERAAGLTRIELEVFSSNTRAIRLYEDCGFVHEGSHRRGRIIDGRVEDVLMMGLLFDE